MPTEYDKKNIEHRNILEGPRANVRKKVVKTDTPKKKAKYKKKVEKRLKKGKSIGWGW